MYKKQIHDNPYTMGAVDFTGDMPVILGLDDPSSGGFICPITVIEADLWQLGQLKAGDKVCFVAMNVPTARRLAAGRRAELTTLQAQDVVWQPMLLTLPLVTTCGDADKCPVACLSGDTHLLLEAGKTELDLVLCLHIHALMQALKGQAREGIIDIIPEIRSLQLHFQSETLALETLLVWVSGEWATVCISNDLQAPTRAVYLPFSWDDPACCRAIDKYMTTARPDAPWRPNNLEFICRINDLPDERTVQNMVLDASYLVMSLDDVYLGASVATPLGPRHRLVTTKYNPARTRAAKNSVDIGKAYLRVYGMEGPNGYQFVGRTLQMWNHYHEVADSADRPWSLRFFDQLRFYPVSADELLEIRRDFPLGRYPLRIEYSTLRLVEYQQFLAREAQSISAFRDYQQWAFNTECDRWIASGQAYFDSQESATEKVGDAPLQPGEQGMENPVSGNLWQAQAAVGRQVRVGDALMVLESIKMGIPPLAPCDSRVQQVDVQPGSTVCAGQRVVVIIEKKAQCNRRLIYAWRPWRRIVITVTPPHGYC